MLRRAVTAMGMLPVRAIVTTGRGIDPALIDAPPNVEVRELASHRKILEDAAAVVTHCGHGTTIKALAAGVPVVGLPMGRDQFDIAARLAHRGAGFRVHASAPLDAIAAATGSCSTTPPTAMPPTHRTRHRPRQHRRPCRHRS